MGQENPLFLVVKTHLAIIVSNEIHSWQVQVIFLGTNFDYYHHCLDLLTIFALVVSVQVFNAWVTLTLHVFSNNYFANETHFIQWNCVNTLLSMCLEDKCYNLDAGQTGSRNNLELSFYEALKATMAYLRRKTHLFLNSPLPWA